LGLQTSLPNPRINYIEELCDNCATPEEYLEEMNKIDYRGKNKVENAKHLVILPRQEAGLFSLFFQVIGNLDYAEINGFVPIVYFNKNCIYWHGPQDKNVWDRLFYPVSDVKIEDIIGNVNATESSCEDLRKSRYKNPILAIFLAEMKSLDKIGNHGLITEEQRKYAARLTKKYIKVRDEILNRVDEFCSNNITKNTIGVHWRGTDKIEECLPISFESIKQEISKFEYDKIFLATEDETKLRHFVAHYGDKVITTDSLHGIDMPPHKMSGLDKTKASIDVLIDCLILSRVKHLIHGQSNVSAAALVFNPDLDHTSYIPR
jgi:hypothetical protein